MNDEVFCLFVCMQGKGKEWEGMRGGKKVKEKEGLILLLTYKQTPFIKERGRGVDKMIFLFSFI